jgi:plastocyanin
MAASKAANSSKVVIYYDNYGFDPNVLTIPVGTTVYVKNISTGPLSFMDMPAQAVPNPSFNLGSIPIGQEKSFVIKNKGVWQYEANGHPEIRGEIGTGPSSYTASQLPNNSIDKTAKNLTVVYDDYGFMPNELSISSGSQITLKNKTTRTQPGPSEFSVASQDGSVSQTFGPIQKGTTATINIGSSGSWELLNDYQPAGKNTAGIQVN